MEQAGLFFCICLGVSIFAGVVSFETESCEGRCSKVFMRGLPCSCDPHCLQFDQCCSDYIDQCTSPLSCEGRCFSKFMRGKDCQCDEACHQYGECCSDFNNNCAPDDGELEDYLEFAADDPWQRDDPWSYPETDMNVDEDVHDDVPEDEHEDEHEDAGQETTRQTLVEQRTPPMMVTWPDTTLQTQAESGVPSQTQEFVGTTYKHTSQTSQIQVEHDTHSPTYNGTTKVTQTEIQVHTVPETHTQPHTSLKGQTQPETSQIQATLQTQKFSDKTTMSTYTDKDTAFPTSTDMKSLPLPTASHKTPQTGTWLDKIIQSDIALPTSPGLERSTQLSTGQETTRQTLAEQRTTPMMVTWPDTTLQTQAESDVPSQTQESVGTTYKYTSSQTSQIQIEHDTHSPTYNRTTNVTQTEIQTHAVPETHTQPYTSLKGQTQPETSQIQATLQTQTFSDKTTMSIYPDKDTAFPTSTEMKSLPPQTASDTTPQTGTWLNKITQSDMTSQTPPKLGTSTTSTVEVSAEDSTLQTMAERNVTLRMVTESDKILQSKLPITVIQQTYNETNGIILTTAQTGITMHTDAQMITTRALTMSSLPTVATFPCVTSSLAPPDTRNDLCKGDAPNAFTTMSNGVTVVFRGGLTWRLGLHGIMGHPRNLQSLWGIPGAPDAVFTRCSCEAHTYIFKDSLYWRVTNGKIDQSFPRPISRGFAGLTGKVNAVLPIPAYRHVQEAAYFLQGNKVRRYIFKHSRPSCKKRHRPRKPFLPESLFPLPRQPSRFSSSSRSHTSRGHVQIHTVSIRNRGRQVNTRRNGRQRHKRGSKTGRRLIMRRKYTNVQRSGELSLSILTSKLWRGVPAQIDSFATFPTFRQRDLIPYKFYITSGVNIYPLDIVRNTVSSVPVGDMKKHWFRCP